MRTTDQPENTDKTNAAHPSLGKLAEDERICFLCDSIFTTGYEGAEGYICMNCAHEAGMA